MIISKFAMKAYAPLQAQNATDETESELSPKKPQTEKLPGLQKVCDTDSLCTDAFHIPLGYVKKNVSIKLMHFMNMYNVMKRVQKISCHQLQSLIIAPRRRLWLVQHHPK